MESPGIDPQSPTKKRRKNWKKVIYITLTLLLVFAVGGTLTAGWYLHRPLPDSEGTLTFSGLRKPVDVYRDDRGVPRILAKNPQDLYYAQGLVTAQDRLFQMEMSRRLASGRLSEVVGEKAVDQDRFFRTFGLRRAAEASLSSYSGEALNALKSYAQGVNAYIRQATENGELPVEFTLLGVEPEPWSPVDSLTIGKYMAYDLGGRWRGQAFRHELLRLFPKKQALELFPTYPQEGPRIAGETSSSLNLSQQLASAVFPREQNGSNNWVVSGKKTESGKPLLANDPHLSIATPAIWYQTELKSPGLHVSGVTFAGVPGIVVGHNEQIAWGVTNVGPDVQDLYIEKRHPDHPDRFLYEGKWEQARRIPEKIRVKDGKDQTLEVMVTRHGPIVTEFARPDGKMKKPDTALSMRWTALEPTTELEAVLRFNRAKNWKEFRKALTYFKAPAQNFVFASTDGTIAYRANGWIPIRQKGEGLLPVPGWKKEYEWKGYIPWEELPAVVNPDSGWIATANNKITGEDYPYHITHTWAEPYRSARIKEVLQQKKNFTVADMEKLQTDTKNLRAQWLTPLLLQQAKGETWTAEESAALQLLRKWNFHDDPKQGAPLLHHLWINELEKKLYQPLNEKTLDLFEGKTQITDHLLRQAADGKPGWWIQNQGGLKKLFLSSFKEAVRRGQDLQGKDPTHWQWGQFHQVVFSHPLSEVSPLNLLFNRQPIPVGGSGMTVMAAGWNFDSGEVDHGASWRTVVDLAKPRHSWDVVGPGQSGQVMSPWYHDQAEDWVQGRYHETRMMDNPGLPDGKLLRLLPSK